MSSCARVNYLEAFHGQFRGSKMLNGERCGLELGLTSYSRGEGLLRLNLSLKVQISNVKIYRRSI